MNECCRKEITGGYFSRYHRGLILLSERSEWYGSKLQIMFPFLINMSYIEHNLYNVCTSQGLGTPAISHDIL